MKLVDTFNSKDAHVEGTFMFVDMFESASYKANGEAAWITTMAWLYDTVGAIVEKDGAGTIVKYLGDGVMIAYGPDAATAAVNVAIQIQEALEDGVEGRQVHVSCSVGVATGEAVRFEVAPGHFDYLGPTIDRAARLCDVASPQAIFVDTDTTDSAQMNKVASKVGAVLRRSPSQYKGDVQKANLKGFDTPVHYHEINWSQQLFGLKSEVVTASIDAAPRATPAARPSDSGQSPVRPDERGHGSVSHWDGEHRRGFIEAEDGERFYTDMRFMVGEDELRPGEEVHFVKRPPQVKDKARVAGAVIAVDQELEGTVVSVRQGFGFVRVRDSHGNSQDLFVSESDCAEELTQQQRVDFVVGATERGPRAEEVRVADGAEVERPRPLASGVA